MKIWFNLMVKGEITQNLHNNYSDFQKNFQNYGIFSLNFVLFMPAPVYYGISMVKRDIFELNVTLVKFLYLKSLNKSFLNENIKVAMVFHCGHSDL